MNFVFTICIYKTVGVGLPLIHDTHPRNIQCVCAER